jgi:hypothetical protein
MLAHTIDTDEELKDDELLGEATLAKLAPVPGPEETASTDEGAKEIASEEAVDEKAAKEKKE